MITFLLIVVGVLLVSFGASMWLGERLQRAMLDYPPAEVVVKLVYVGGEDDAETVERMIAMGESPKDPLQRDLGL